MQFSQVLIEWKVLSLFHIGGHANTVFSRMNEFVGLYHIPLCRHPTTTFKAEITHKNSKSQSEIPSEMFSWFPEREETVRCIAECYTSHFGTTSEILSYTRV